MTAQQDFWNWFTKHEPDLFDFEKDREKIFDQIASELAKVDPDLTFEIGPKEPTRDFVISAAGIRRAFPAVVALSTTAPRLARWKIIAFRPRRPPMTIELGDHCIDPDAVFFSLTDDGKLVGVSLFIPGLISSEIVFKQIGYLLLDEALGEYDVETKIGLIEMLAPESRQRGDRYPFRELAKHFDQAITRLEGSPTRPS